MKLIRELAIATNAIAVGYNSAMLISGATSFPEVTSLMVVANTFLLLASFCLRPAGANV